MLQPVGNVTIGPGGPAEGWKLLGWYGHTTGMQPPSPRHTPPSPQPTQKVGDTRQPPVPSQAEAKHSGAGAQEYVDPMHAAVAVQVSLAVQARPSSQGFPTAAA